MIYAKRKEMIISLLKEKKVVDISELSKYLEVTPMTIRRDLEKLETENILIRSHGGAILSKKIKKEQIYTSKESENIENKIKIAEVASKFVKEGNSILLDSGTTTFQIAIAIKNIPDITVVTPDLKIATLLSESKTKIFFLGGEIQNETRSSLCQNSVEFIKNTYTDICFIGTSSISKDLILCTPTYEKRLIKKLFLDSASKKILVCDESKFNQEALFKITSIGEFDHIVTDKKFSQQEKKILSNLNESADFILNV